MMKKNIIVSTITILTAGALLFGATSTFAETDDVQTFAQKLAQKLGIEESKVKTALTELHSERQAEIKKKVEERLNQLVTEGKLTREQKDKILAKQKELSEKREANKEALKNKTTEERKELMEKEREELKTWAKENGIDLQYLMGPMKRHKGMRFKMMR